MSFSSLLAEITKDKKLEDKLKKEEKKFIGLHSLNKKNAKSRTQPVRKSDNVTKWKTSGPTRNVGLKSESLHRDYRPDPAVERLKAARRKERERLQAIKDAKFGKKVTRRSATSGSRPSVQGRLKNHVSARSRATSSGKATRPKRSTSRHNRAIEAIKPLKVTAVGPKMSFKELMKKADEMKEMPHPTVQHVKRDIGMHKEAHVAHRRPQNVKEIRRARPRLQLHSSFSGRPSKELLEKLSRRKAKQKAREKVKRAIRTSRPVQSFQTRKEEKHTDKYGIDATDSDDDDGSYDEDVSSRHRRLDDDLDDFIVDDEDDDRATKENRHRAAIKRDGYDRDEIWSIFNRGRKRRRDYGYDSYEDMDEDDDDMEATGAEVLDEEERTLRQAKLDDRKEAAILERHRQEKQKKKKRQMSH